MVTIAKYHVITSAEDTAGWAYIYIPIDGFAELNEITVWGDGVNWGKVTIGLQDEAKVDFGLRDAYSCNAHGVRWEAQKKVTQYLTNIKITIEDPTATDPWTIKVNYQVKNHA